MWYYTEQGKPFIFRCTNRLDRDTSGLTVIAKHLISSSILSSMGARHEIKREYLAIVRGSVTPPSGTIDAPLARTGSSMIERKVDFKHGERAVTHYKVVEEKNGHSLVSLILETGRTHQIRVHMQYLGFPLVGDYLYNPDGIHPPPGITFLEALLYSSDHKGADGIHSGITERYEEDSYLKNTMRENTPHHKSGSVFLSILIH